MTASTTPSMETNLKEEAPWNENSNNINNKCTVIDSMEGSTPVLTETTGLVETLYGRGRLIESRPKEGVHVIQLCTSQRTVYSTELRRTRTATLAEDPKEKGTQMPPEAIKEEKEEEINEKDPLQQQSRNEPTQNKKSGNNRTRSSMELNVAYETLEKMRRLNLEVKCHEQGISEINFDQCATCLLSCESKTRFPRLQKFVDSNRASLGGAITGSTVSEGSLTTTTTRFPRLSKVLQDATTTAARTSATATTTSARFPRIAKLVQETRRASSSFGEDEEDASSQPSTTTTASSTTTTTSSSSTAQEPSATVSHNNTKVLPRIQKLLDDRQTKAASPCLICANPTCPAHASSTFRKEGITLCGECERLFELQFITDCVSSPPKQRQEMMDHLVDKYDRSLLLLKYSSLYIEQIAAALEESKEQQNKIGLGSSSAGVVSGALGIAAAATILTPVGAPLLITSLLFGGSATVVQTSSEALHYFSQPRQLADRIIALHGMCRSILRVTSLLRDALMRNHIRTDSFEDEENTTQQEGVVQHKALVGARVTSNVGRGVTLGGAVTTAAGMETAQVGARSATALSRAGTAAARTVRFARFAGGALSAAVLVLEANAIQSTCEQIRAGNPCEKAQLLRTIRDDLSQLASTESLEEEIQIYLKTLAEQNPDRPLLLNPVDVPDNLCPAGATIIDGKDDEENDPADMMTKHAESPKLSASSSSVGSRSLLERIQLHKMQKAAAKEEDHADANRFSEDRMDELRLDLL